MLTGFIVIPIDDIPSSINPTNENIVNIELKYNELKIFEDFNVKKYNNVKVACTFNKYNILNDLKHSKKSTYKYYVDKQYSLYSNSLYFIKPIVSNGLNNIYYINYENIPVNYLSYYCSNINHGVFIYSFLLSIFEFYNCYIKDEFIINMFNNKILKNGIDIIFMIEEIEKKHNIDFDLCWFEMRINNLIQNLFKSVYNRISNNIYLNAITNIKKEYNGIDNLNVKITINNNNYNFCFIGNDNSIPLDFIENGFMYRIDEYGNDLLLHNIKTYNNKKYLEYVIKSFNTFLNFNVSCISNCIIEFLDVVDVIRITSIINLSTNRIFISHDVCDMFNESLLKHIKLKTLIDSFDTNDICEKLNNKYYKILYEIKKINNYADVIHKKINRYKKKYKIQNLIHCNNKYCILCDGNIFI